MSNPNAAASIKEQNKSAASSLLKKNVRKFLNNKLAVFGLVVVVIITLACIIGAIMGVDYATPDLTNMKAAPEAGHIFGTDTIGRDLLARVLIGGCYSILIGVFCAVLSSVIGAALGAIAGYFGGWVDNIIMRVVDVFYCIPSMPVIIIIGAAMDAMRVDSWTRMMYLMLILGFLGWPGIARLVRGQILSLREQEFMLATEACGINVWHRIFRHLIPNVIPQLIVTCTMGLGSTILTDVEALSHGTLYWRSFSHWVGGMGVLVFLLSLLPLTGGSHVNLMKAESPGPQVDKLVPKVQSTAKILYGIYFALTVVEVCFLLAGGMNVFDSLLTAFGTAGTGGFGFKNDSFASFSPYIQWVVTVFMILFGVNFNAYFLLLLRRFRRAASSEEVRAYFAIILAAVAVITVNIRSLYGTFGEALRHAAFQVGSIITTTGFSSCDFDLWPTLAKEVLVLLMFVGACAGSTGGGIKVSRFLLLGKTLGKELKQALHPQVVAPVRMDGKLVNHETIRTTNVFLAAYIFIFAASFMLVSLDGFDMVTNFTSIAATLNNIGPGLNQVGPMMNFGAYSNFAKLVLIFDMLAGRLEIFPMLVLFLPDAWRRF